MADEYEGTSPGLEGDGGSSGVITGPSVDPASIGGNATGTGGSGDDFTFDPERHIGLDKRNSDGSYRRKRGRKSGKSGSARATASKGDLKGAAEMLAQTMLLVHVGLASSTRTPELAIDKAEADLLAQATVNVLDQFDMKPDPGFQAIAGLIIAAGTVYGPRIVVIRARKNEEAEKRVAEQASPVFTRGFDVAGTNVASFVPAT